MFEEDVKKINACIEHKDYYSAMEYAIFVKEKYKSEKRKYFEDIIRYVKNGNYEKIEYKNKRTWYKFYQVLMVNRNLSNTKFNFLVGGFVIKFNIRSKKIKK